jgi:nucleotide-binding universal stress UspA family protein
MLLRMATLDAIAAGEVTTAYRRWTRPTVKEGGTLVTAIGVLSIDALDVVDPATITEADARRAGHASREDVLAMLAQKSAGDVYRVTFHVAGEDPRIALRERDDLSAEDVALLTRRLGRLDARPSGPWTERVLRLIGEREAVRAGDLADELGMERLAFKADVRKLKALGLTESLGTGYRLSPRGQAWLDR